MPAQTYLFGCLSDNFGVLLHDPETGATASIDAPEAGPVEAGQWELFKDTRLSWGLERLGGIAGGSVLELGPLEGGHWLNTDNPEGVLKLLVDNLP